MSGSPVEVAAVSGVSFAVGAGEMVAMIGPTGSGKSTLAQIMAGLMAPTSGQVIIDGTDLAGDRHLASLSPAQGERGTSAVFVII